MTLIFKTIPFLRIFFGLTAIFVLYDVSRIIINLFLHTFESPFQNYGMTGNFSDLGFFILYSYALSRYIFIKHEISDQKLIIKHPLGKIRVYQISDIKLIEEDGEFSKWPRLYKGMNWLRLHMKDGKEINITWLNDHYTFLQELKR